MTDFPLWAAVEWDSQVLRAKVAVAEKALAEGADCRAVAGPDITVPHGHCVRF